MSSLARRSLRTTAAAAGIAALGLGFAGSALAAPELPALPGLDGLPEAPAAPGLDGLPAAPEAPGMPSAEGWSVPGVVNLEMPAVNTDSPELPAGDAFEMPALPGAEGLAGGGLPELPALPVAQDAPALPEAPGTDALPEAPSTEGIVNMGGGLEQVSGPTPDGFGQNQVGALAAADTAKMIAEMAQSASAGESMTENHQIG